MACPTCDHTMQNTGAKMSHNNEYLFVCPRCGTARHGDHDYVPWLVKRCVDFGNELKGSEEEYLIDLYRSLGINESISK